MLAILAATMIGLAKTIMDKNIELIKNDEAGRVSDLGISSDGSYALRKIQMDAQKTSVSFR